MERPDWETPDRHDSGTCPMCGPYVNSTAAGRGKQRAIQESQDREEE